MEYDISLSDEGNYIIVKYRGNIKADIALKSTLESQALAKEHGIFCILVNVIDSRNLENAMKNYDFAYKTFQNAKIEKRSCVALLVAPDDHSHDFMETLLRNNGHDVTIFRDREMAIRYFKKAWSDKKTTGS